MWNLDDQELYELIYKFTIPNVFTYGDDDLKRREQIRELVLEDFPTNIPKYKWFAFRIKAIKSGNSIDIDNVPKIIIDSFSEEQINRDRARRIENEQQNTEFINDLYDKFNTIALYDDDTIEFVRMVQAYGEMIENGESSTVVEIFGRKN